MKTPQLKLFKSQSKACGGELYKKRNGRGPRVLDTKNSMHLVLRSTLAVGTWSFLKFNKTIKKITEKFCKVYGIQLIKIAVVGNHIHFHLKLSNRHTYKMFIKALTSSIMMKVTGASKINKIEKKFWDYRPFTRIVIGYKAFLRLNDYIELNLIELDGFTRGSAREILRQRVEGPEPAFEGMY